jgi:prepilin peptidase CpaA
MVTMLEPVSVISLVVVLVAGTVAAFTDLRDFKVPNLITLPLLIAGILFHGLDPSGNGFTFAVQGGLLGFSFLILFYVMGGMGAGDVKLLAAIGTWVGPSAIFALFIISALLGGLYALILTWRQGTLAENLLKVRVILQHGMTIFKHLGREERIEQAVKRDDRRRRLIPFAAMVLGGIALLVAAKFIVH